SHRGDTRRLAGVTGQSPPPTFPDAIDPSGMREATDPKENGNAVTHTPHRRNPHHHRRRTHHRSHRPADQRRPGAHRYRSPAGSKHRPQGNCRPLSGPSASVAREAHMIIRHGWQGTPGVLSQREVEFTLAVAAGLTDKEIAREAGLAPDSVRKRIANAMYKLGASRRAQLVAEALRRAVIAPLAVLMAVCLVTVGAQPDIQPDRQNRNPIVRVRPYRHPDTTISPFVYVS